jgi:hypothetical protein
MSVDGGERTGNDGGPNPDLNAQNDTSNAGSDGARKPLLNEIALAEYLTHEASLDVGGGGEHDNMHRSAAVAQLINSSNLIVSPAGSSCMAYPPDAVCEGGYFLTGSINYTCAVCAPGQYKVGTSAATECTQKNPSTIVCGPGQ